MKIIKLKSSNLDGPNLMRHNFPKSFSIFISKVCGLKERPSTRTIALIPNSEIPNSEFTARPPSLNSLGLTRSPRAVREETATIAQGKCREQSGHKVIYSDPPLEFVHCVWSCVWHLWELQRRIRDLEFASDNCKPIGAQPGCCLGHFLRIRVFAVHTSTSVHFSPPVGFDPIRTRANPQRGGHDPACAIVIFSHPSSR